MFIDHKLVSPCRFWYKSHPKDHFFPYQFGTHPTQFTTFPQQNSIHLQLGLQITTNHRRYFPQLRPCPLWYPRKSSVLWLQLSRLSDSILIWFYPKIQHGSSAIPHSIQITNSFSNSPPNTTDPSPVCFPALPISDITVSLVFFACDCPNFEVRFSHNSPPLIQLSHTQSKIPNITGPSAINFK